MHMFSPPTALPVLAAPCTAPAQSPLLLWVQTMSRADIEEELQARGITPVGAKSELKVQAATVVAPFSLAYPTLPTCRIFLFLCVCHVLEACEACLLIERYNISMQVYQLKGAAQYKLSKTCALQSCRSLPTFVDLSQAQAGLQMKPRGYQWHLCIGMLVWHTSSLGLHNDRVQEILERVLSTEYPNDPNAQPLRSVSEANPPGMRLCLPVLFASPASLPMSASWYAAVHPLIVV